MGANTDPIYSRVADNSANASTTLGPQLLAAANDYTGVNANNQLAFTADPTNGGYLQRLRFKAKGTNVQSVARIYLNNGSDPTVAANNRLIDEVQMPATTISATVPTPTIDWMCNAPLAPGFRIYVGLSTAVAAGWDVTPFAGKY